MPPDAATAAGRWSAQRLLATVGLSTLAWAVLATLCLMVGSTDQTWYKGFGIPVIGPAVGLPVRDPFGVRLESVLLASLIGAALASAGVAYQSILRNPLADPYLLGVSTGAALGAFLWRFPAATDLMDFVSDAGPDAMSEQVFAFAGALLSVAVVFLLASRRGRLEPVTLLLVGIIVNAVNASVFLLIHRLSKTLSDETSFLVGVIRTNLVPAQVYVAMAVVFAGWMILMSLAGQLNVATLSEGEAVSLGVRIHRLRWGALVVASLVTAAAVAISGPIGFVGLVGPHLARLLVGHDQRRLLPVATALGAALLAVADAATRWLSRDAIGDTQLPVGVLTGLMGGPFFLLLLHRARRRASDAL